MLASQEYTLSSGIGVTLEAWHTTYWPSDKRKKPLKFTNHMSAKLALGNIPLYSGTDFHEAENRNKNIKELVRVLTLLKASPNDVEDIKAGIFSLARELNVQID